MSMKGSAKIRMSSKVLLEVYIRHEFAKENKNCSAMPLQNKWGMKGNRASAGRTKKVNFPGVGWNPWNKRTFA